MNFTAEEKLRLLEDDLERYNKFVDHEKHEKYILSQLDTCIINIPKFMTKHTSYYINLYFNKLRKEFIDEINKLKQVEIRTKFLNEDFSIMDEEIYNKLKKVDAKNEESLYSVKYAVLCDKILKFNIYMDYIYKMTETLEKVYNEEDCFKELNEIIKIAKDNDLYDNNILETKDKYDNEKKN